MAQLALDNQRVSRIYDVLSVERKIPLDGAGHYRMHTPVAVIIVSSRLVYTQWILVMIALVPMLYKANF